MARALGEILKEAQCVNISFEVCAHILSYAALLFRESSSFFNAHILDQI